MWKEKPDHSILRTIPVLCGPHLPGGGGGLYLTDYEGPKGEGIQMPSNGLRLPAQQ